MVQPPEDSASLKKAAGPPCKGWAGPQPVMQRQTPFAFLLVLSVLSCLTSGLLAEPDQGTTVEVHVSTGQELADAVATWGSTGSNMTVIVDVPYISTRNATFTNYSTILARAGPNLQPFSQGVLTVRGQPNLEDPSKPTTILDAGMRASLIPVVMSYPAQILYQDLVLVNACELRLPFLPDRINPPSPFYNPLFGPKTFSYQSEHLTNIASYGRQAALAFHVYQAGLMVTALPELRSLEMPEIIQPSNIPIVPMEEFSPYFVGIESYTWAMGVYTNLSVKSLANPGDPMLIKLMADGKIMPPQYCNGTLLPQKLVDEEIDPETGPLRIADDQASFLRVLALTAAQTEVQQQIRGPPAQMMLAKGLYTAPSTGTFKVSDLMVASGATGRNGVSTPSDTFYALVDLNQRVSLFDLAPGARMIVQWLVISGFASQVPSMLPPGLSSDNLLPSVFPLAAFKTVAGPDTWRNSSSVVMYNVTLVIPPDDYLALLILAARRANIRIDCPDAATIQRAAQLQAGFHVMTITAPASPEAFLQPPLKFDQLQGWGLNASLVQVRPSSPVQLPLCSSSRGTSRSTRATIGMAVGIACGCTLLALLAGWWWYRKHSKHTEHNMKAAVWASSSRSSSFLARNALCDSSGEPGSHRVTETTDPFSDTTSSTAGLDGSGFADSHMGDLNESSLMLGVRQAHDRLQARLASIDNFVTEPGANAQHGTAAVVSPDAMHGQIQQLAAQLNPEGSNQLVLAGMLGTGRGGTVLMGLWKGMRVAVKTMVYHEDFALLKQGAAEPETLQPRALMETAIAASVGHPNLVATFHYDIKALAATRGSDDKGGLQVYKAVANPFGRSKSIPNVLAYKVFLIQELCDLSLAVALEQGLYRYLHKDALDMNSVLLTLLHVAHGLEYLHDKHIIHGDLKPGNIMLKVAPELPCGIIAKLTDFGLSTKLGPGATHVSNFNYGSPFYVAPEVVHHHRMSPASDIFSFGVVMWELASQCRPYVAAADGTAVPHPMFPRLPPDCTAPPMYENLMSRCCSINPQERPSAQAIVWKLTKQIMIAELLPKASREDGALEPSSTCTTAP